MVKIAIILLTWSRPQRFIKTLEMLEAQTNKNFELHVSSGATKIHNFCKKTTDNFNSSFKIYLHNDGNKYSCFRRFFLAKELAKSGTEIVINIDDDIEFGSTLVEEAISQYEPKTIKASKVWHLHDGSDYFTNRTLVTDKQDSLEADYAVGQLGVFDSSFFLQDELYNVVKHVYECDDLWASYVAKEKLGWQIKPFNFKIKDNGGDKAALYKKLKNKNEIGLKQLLLNDLVGRGWLASRAEKI